LQRPERWGASTHGAHWSKAFSIPKSLGSIWRQEAMEAARKAGKTLLVLDTASGEAERIYTRLGWTFAGAIPDYALWPQGGLCSTRLYYRNLG
jgi:hypothetical protein